MNLRKFLNGQGIVFYSVMVVVGIIVIILAINGNVLH